MATHSFTCKQAIPTFTPSRKASPPFGWYSFYCPTEGRRLSRSGWLVTFRNKVPPRESHPDTVTHRSTNRAQRRLTSLIETNALPLRQTTTTVSLKLDHPPLFFPLATCRHILWTDISNNWTHCASTSVFSTNSLRRRCCCMSIAACKKSRDPVSFAECYSDW